MRFAQCLAGRLPRGNQLHELGKLSDRRSYLQDCHSGNSCERHGRMGCKSGKGVPDISGILALVFIPLIYALLYKRVINQEIF